ncbi:YIPF7 protein [Salpingoeca rosetta]|uniref:Protein YIPF n=1 Tax=Salpingoeca rosetta (strain ATCC 50818 / BSB-021) TaxID=946362 RepID=F2UGN6_SALR5|nr:YIPF7 protein [Salpingoeca rosetta]EGD75786.1 YIPF7 protein [Salpingoeca rosetta]|eukprot:XP_004991707.1 YIPF7 protein [Salpingoeca rosetta]
MSATIDMDWYDEGGDAAAEMAQQQQHQQQQPAGYGGQQAQHRHPHHHQHHQQQQPQAAQFQPLPQQQGGLPQPTFVPQPPPIPQMGTGATGGSSGFSGGFGGMQQTFFQPTGSIGSQGSAFASDDDEEEPLLQELGINFRHIADKTGAVLNVTKAVDSHLMDDTDLAGPLVFCVAYSAFLLMSGKLEFGSVYGVAVVGCLGMYTVLSLMTQSPHISVSLSRTASVLGYSLLPMVGLSSIAILLSLSGVFGSLLAAISIAWCTHSASRIFTSVMTHGSDLRRDS